MQRASSTTGLELRHEPVLFEQLGFTSLSISLFY